MEHDVDISTFGWGDMLRAYWYFLRGQRAKWVLAIVLFILSFLVTSYLPGYVFGRMILYFQSYYHHGDSLQNFFLVMTGVTCLTAVVAVLRVYSRREMNRVNTEVRYDARIRGFERLMQFPYSWHQRETAGIKVQRLNTGISDIIGFGRALNTTAFQTLTSIISVVVVFSFVNGSLTLFFLAYAVLTGLIELFYYRRTFKLNNEVNAAGEKTSGIYHEATSNVLTVKALGAMSGVREAVVQTESKARDRGLDMMYLTNAKYRLYNGLSTLGFGGFLILLGYLYAQGAIPLAFLATYTLYFRNASGAAFDLGDMVSDMVDYKTGIARMMPIYWDDLGPGGTEQFPSDWKEIRFDDVRFTYPDKEEGEALQQVSFTIRKNQKVGIVGKSGSGKSTLAKLLLAMYAPNSGTVSIDAVNVGSLKDSERSSHIVPVLQEPELFSLSVRENITLYREGSEQDLERAVQVAQLEGVIAKLPKGLDTLIGEKGYKLSGGERQRIGIARAVYGNAEIVVLDEATSALDSHTELALQEALEQNLGDRTMMIIAHRLSTLHHVDTIYVMDEGVIVESGTFDELLARENGLFRSYYELQQREETAG